MLRLTSLLSLAGLNGHAAVAALQGMFTLPNAPLLAFVLMAGPGAIISATLLEGTIKERFFAALLSGLIATAIILLAATAGPKLFDFVNQDIIKIAGGISILSVGLLILGLKIPSPTPIVIMLLGIIAAGVFR